jgi:hypothetical protein
MKESIYLLINRNGVQGMRKTLPDTRRGEVVVKLNLVLPEGTFKPPMLAQDVVINDWQDGIDMADVEFRQAVITPEEAQAIREKRLAKMQEILEAQGYEVKKPDAPQA